MTKKEKTKKLIVIIFLLIVCSVLIYIYKQNKQVLPVKTIVDNQILAILKINNTEYETIITKETSVYDFMTQLQNEGKITFKDKTYSGMGKFIEEINGLKNGDKNWIYYVNNKKAEIGASNYKINSGDIVSWKYETY